MNATRDKKKIMHATREKKSTVLCTLPEIGKVYVMHATRDRKSVILRIPSEISVTLNMAQQRRKVLFDTSNKKSEIIYFMHGIRAKKIFIL